MTNNWTFVAEEHTTAYAAAGLGAGTAFTVTTPTGTVADDVLVMIAFCGNDSRAGWSGPAGWSAIKSGADAGSVGIHISYYKVVGTAAGNYTWTWGLSGTAIETIPAILCYRNATNVLDDAGALIPDAGSSHATTAFTADIGTNSLFVAGYGALKNNTDPTITLPSGMTSRVSFVGTSGAAHDELRICDIAQDDNSVPAFTATSSGSFKTVAYVMFADGDPATGTGDAWGWAD